MSLITRMRKQTAVYWPPTSSTDNHGKPVNRPAVEIKCRWEDVVTEYVDADGKKQISNSTVYVDRDLELEGILVLGQLKKLKSATDPFLNPGACAIKWVQKLPNLRVTEYLRTCKL